MSMQLVMYRGDDRSWEVTLTVDGEPVDLTGADITFTAREALDDEEPVLVLTSNDGDITIDPDQTTDGKGKLVLAIGAEATEDLERGTTLLCDFEVTDLEGLKRTWPEAVYGQSTLIRLRIKGDVTHA